MILVSEEKDMKLISISLIKRLSISSIKKNLRLFQMKVILSQLESRKNVRMHELNRKYLIA